MSSDAAIKAALDAAATKLAMTRGETAAWCGCTADAAWAVAAFLREMASAGVSLAHMHEWHDLAAKVQEAARDAE